MTRPLPLAAPSLSVPAAPTPLFGGPLRIEVVTPLFGGGALARQVDPEQPVRGASIRGHLRFWWRACRSGPYTQPGDAADLFRREAELWGSTTQPAAIQVDVAIVNAGQRVTYQQVAGAGGANNPLTYALFPFQANQGQPPADALRGVVFQLTLTPAPLSEAWLRERVATLRKADPTLDEADLRARLVPERLEELAGEAGAALWAWLTFGGLGARTRRGCGSLRCTSHAQFAPPTNLNQLATWLKQKRADHVTPIPPLATGEERVPRLLPVPTLAGAVVVWGQQATSVEAAWGQALRPMRELRQGEGIGRTPGWVRANGQYRPSISYWPEPNSLRVKLGIMDPDHPADPEKPLYFPRADLGLPIIFQRLRTGGGNPVLQAVGDGTTRFASPVVLKPLSLAPNQAVALFLLLNSPRVWSADRQVSPGIEVVDGGTSYPLATADLFDAAKSARVRPLAGPPVPPAGQPTTPPLDARSAAVSIYRARFAQWVRL